MPPRFLAIRFFLRRFAGKFTCSPVNQGLNPTAISCAVLLGLTPTLRADWKDEIGFTRLHALTGVGLPATPIGGLTQVEAIPQNTTNYSPNTSNTLFSNKTFNLKSGASGISAHATSVATNFYGSSSLLPGSSIVDLYSAGGWLESDFLHRGTNSEPVTELRAVQNHSWIGSFGSETIDTEINQRLDYAINRDGFVCVVGVNNSSGNPLPALLAQSYHTISVGLANGNHSAGSTTFDGTGRIKPDVVAPDTLTSYATPMVAGAAGLLHAKLSSAPYSLAGANLPRVVKALLLASATKNTVPNWDNTSTRPLDDRYGSGELNIHHAWHAMSAGRKSSGNTTHGIRGWTAETVSSNSSATCFFNIPTSPASTPFCAALTWHRVVTTSMSTGWPFAPRWWSSSLANLNLRLHQTSGFTVGALIAESSSTVDNVEMIYQPALAPGDYALVVQNTSGTNTPFALAWHSLPVVTIAATQPVAREIDGQQATVTLTRNGDTTLPMQVPLTIGGTAVSGSHYVALPATVTIPAGESTLTLQVTPISDSLAQGDRSVAVSVAADFALARDAGQSAVVTIQDKPFDAWRFANFTGPELADPAISGETGDPDGDNLANLIEYALGLAPKASSASPFMMLQPANHLTIAATKNPVATDITWGAEVSGNLSFWSPAVVLTNDASTFTARDNLLITDADRRFIRLKIIRP